MQYFPLISGMRGWEAHITRNAQPWTFIKIWFKHVPHIGAEWTYRLWPWKTLFTWEGHRWFEHQTALKRQGHGQGICFDLCLFICHLLAIVHISSNTESNLIIIYTCATPLILRGILWRGASLTEDRLLPFLWVMLFHGLLWNGYKILIPLNPLYI